MCLFHKWGKWKEYTVKIPERSITENWAWRAEIQKRQRKTCEKCGKIKDRLIVSHLID